MNSFNRYLDTHSVKSSDGRTIKCNYRHHSLFDINSPLSFQLHFVFLHFASERSYTQGYSLNGAYLHLFDYLTGRHKTVNATKVNSLADINSEIFNGFQQYLKKTNNSIFYASTLKIALKSVAETTGQIPFLLLPTVDLPERKKTEPLSQETFDSLSSALQHHIDSLYEKIQFRKDVDAAEPYHFETINSEFSCPYTRENIFRWFQHQISIGIKSAKQSKTVRSKLIKSNDPELLKLSSNEDVLNLFINLYETEGQKYLLEVPTNPFNGTIRTWIPDNKRTIKTILCNGYPMDVPLDHHTSQYRNDKIINLEQCDSVTKILLHRHVRCSNYVKNGIRYPTPLWDEILGMYFPTMVDMSAIAIFIMLQSGWNKETVLAIDGNDFEDILNGMINDNFTVVFSEKHRSQSAAQPYFTPKRFSALSSKDNKYSVHNLILLAQDLSSPLKDSPFDFINLEKDETALNPLFLCIRYFADWAKKGGRHTSISNQKAFRIGTKHFLTLYPIFEDGVRLTTPGDFTSRLRATWMKFNKKKKPLSVLALQQGHEDSNTTDVYYDSSGAAMQERYELLRSELEEVIGLLRCREFSGLMGKAATALSNEELKIFTIPGAEFPLWGCSNQLRPDWPGHKAIVEPGKKCFEINKCIFCSRIRIFEDSLPYLIERLQQVLDTPTEFDKDVVAVSNQEAEIIQFILDNWNDDEALRRAARIQQRCSPLLPNDLSSLRLIFSEGGK